MNLFKRNWLTLFVISVLYFVYAVVVLSPQTYKRFSLIDDGQSIRNSDYFTECLSEKDCENVSSILSEKEFGRFRPGYWLTQYSLYSVLGLNPVLHHSFRILVIGYLLLVLLVIAVILAKGNFFGLLTASLMFITSYTFTENIVRLGPQEPYQLLFVVLFVLGFIYRNRVGLWPLLLLCSFAILVKETSVVVILPVLAISFYERRTIKDIKYIFAFIIVGAFITLFGRVLSSPEGGILAYTENYQLSLPDIFHNSLEYLRIISTETSPFLKILSFISVLALILEPLRRKFLDKHLLMWLVFFIVFTSVLFPWRYVLERYVLLSIFSISIVTGIVLSRAKDYFFSFLPEETVWYKKLSAMTVGWAIGLNLFFYGLPLNLAKTLNYREWYSSFLNFEYEQVQAISQVKTDKVYVNAKDTLDNWEILFEIPLHLHYIFGSDISMERVDVLPKEGYLFTRTPFELSIDIDTLRGLNLPVLESKSYEISQIDPLKFRESFHYRPIQTVLKPPLASGILTYTWDIQVIK